MPDSINIEKLKAAELGLNLSGIKTEMPFAPNVSGVKPLAALQQEELRLQELSGKQLQAQAEHVLNTPLLQYVIKNSLRDRGCLLTSRTTRAIQWLADRVPEADAFIAARQSPEEIRLADILFCRQWPDLNIYDLIGQDYPALHAQTSGYVPKTIAAAQLENSLNSLILQDRKKQAKGFRSGLLRLLLDAIPSLELPAEDFLADSKWTSQDWIGRRDTACRIIKCACSAIRAGKVFRLIDEAGGTANNILILFEEITKLDQAERELLIKEGNLTVYVRDISSAQLDAGRHKIRELEKKLGILCNVTFIEESITLKRFKPDRNTITAAITSYTPGALPPALIKEAGNVFSDYDMVLARDFSEGAFMRDVFLKQTGAFGRAYIRMLHGRALPGDSLWRKFLTGTYSLGRGLYNQYRTWPGRGHEAGWGLEVVDGKHTGYVEAPNISLLAVELEKHGHKIINRFNVKSFAIVPVGRIARSSDLEVKYVPGWTEQIITTLNSTSGNYDLLQALEKGDICDPGPGCGGFGQPVCEEEC